MQTLNSAPQKYNRFVIRYKLMLYARIVSAALLPLTLIAMISGFAVRRMQWRINDVAGASLQSGTARVAAALPIDKKVGRGVRLRLSVNGRTAEVEAFNDERLIWTHEGDTIPVTYRVGNSGAVYIENWQAPPHQVSLPR